MGSVELKSTMTEISSAVDKEAQLKWKLTLSTEMTKPDQGPGVCKPRPHCPGVEDTEGNKQTNKQTTPQSRKQSELQTGQTKKSSQHT